MGRRATKNPHSETAFTPWPYINSQVSRATTREVMRIRPENRGAFITHTAEAQPHGLGPVFDFLPRDFPEKQLWVERAFTKGVDVCDEW